MTIQKKSTSNIPSKASKGDDKKRADAKFLGNIKEQQENDQWIEQPQFTSYRIDPGPGEEISILKDEDGVNKTKELRVPALIHKTKKARLRQGKAQAIKQEQE